MSHRKCLATERAVDFISIFYKVTFLDIITKTSFRPHYRVVRSFPALHFDAKKMSLMPRVEHQKL